MLATVHIPIYCTVPIAVILVVWLIWYWYCLAAARIPPLCRFIRRVSVVLIVSFVPTFCLGMSVYDAVADQRGYVTVWTIAVLQGVLIVGVTGIDMLLSFVAYHQARESLSCFSPDGRLAKALDAWEERDGGTDAAEETDS